MKTPLRLLIMLPLAVLAIAAAPRLNWNTTVAVTPAGTHVIGNPKAQVKLAEYVSYTCPHCAAFEKESDGAMRIGYIHSGKVSVEVVHMLRDPIDLTVAMLTNCGSKDRFVLNHAAFMRSQDTWIKPLVTASQAQRSRWTSGDFAMRGRAIASDFHFYEIMATRGYDRITVDRCLADKAMAQRLAAQGEAGAKLGVTSTPTFAINGTLLEGTNDWATLRPQIDAAL